MSSRHRVADRGYQHRDEVYRVGILTKQRYLPRETAARISTSFERDPERQALRTSPYRGALRARRGVGRAEGHRRRDLRIIRMLLTRTHNPLSE